MAKPVGHNLEKVTNKLCTFYPKAEIKERMILFLNREKETLEVNAKRRRNSPADFEKGRKKFPKMALKYYCKKIWVWKNLGCVFGYEFECEKFDNFNHVLNQFNRSSTKCVRDLDYTKQDYHFWVTFDYFLSMWYFLRQLG